MSYAKSQALVLYGDDAGVEALMAFRQRLGEALADAGFKPKRAFTPHMTLLRDKRLVLKHRITPITWQVTELVLVHSLLGQTTHRYVRRIPLRRR